MKTRIAILALVLISAIFTSTPVAADGLFSPTVTLKTAAAALEAELGLE